MTYYILHVACGTVALDEIFVIHPPTRSGTGDSSCSCGDAAVGALIPTHPPKNKLKFRPTTNCKRGGRGWGGGRMITHHHRILRDEIDGRRCCNGRQDLLVLMLLVLLKVFFHSGCRIYGLSYPILSYPKHSHQKATKFFFYYGAAIVLCGPQFRFFVFFFFVYLPNTRSYNRPISQT